MSADQKIEDILAKYGEPMQGNIWRVQGQAVIYHKALERIAAYAGIDFDEPTIVRAEADEAVILVRGRLNEKRVWSIGEAKINVNYRVSGRQAAYVYAMAEKRAVDRVILKLIGLHGLLYSEDEADQFKSGARPVVTDEGPSRDQIEREAIETGKPVEEGNGVCRPEDVIARKLAKLWSVVNTSKRAITIREWLDDPETDELLNHVDEDEAHALRKTGWARIAELERAP